jgi:hypothetical protein
MKLSRIILFIIAPIMTGIITLAIVSRDVPDRSHSTHPDERISKEPSVARVIDAAKEAVMRDEPSPEAQGATGAEAKVDKTAAVEANADIGEAGAPPEGPASIDAPAGEDMPKSAPSDKPSTVPGPFPGGVSAPLAHSSPTGPPGPAKSEPLPDFVPASSAAGSSSASQPASQNSSISSFVPVTTAGGPVADSGVTHRQLPAFTPVTNTTGPVKKEQ